MIADNPYGVHNPIFHVIVIEASALWLFIKIVVLTLLGCFFFTTCTQQKLEEMNERN